MTLGDRIRALRESRSDSRPELAAALGVSRQSVGMWESGTTEPSTENLGKIAVHFDLSDKERLELYELKAGVEHA